MLQIEALTRRGSSPRKLSSSYSFLTTRWRITSELSLAYIETASNDALAHPVASCARRFRCRLATNRPWEGRLCGRERYGDVSTGIHWLSYFRVEFGHFFSGVKMVFQSFFMLTTVQPRACASSIPLSKRPMLDWRS